MLSTMCSDSSSLKYSSNISIWLFFSMHLSATSQRDFTWAANDWSLSTFFMNLAYCCCSVGSTLSGQPIFKHQSTSLAMVHALISCANSKSVDVVNWHFGEVVNLDEVRIPEDIIFVFLFLIHGVENSWDGFGVSKAAWSTKLLPDFGVLIELGHFWEGKARIFKMIFKFENTEYKVKIIVEGKGISFSPSCTQNSQSQSSQPLVSSFRFSQGRNRSN